MGAPGNWHFLPAEKKRFKDLVGAEHWGSSDLGWQHRHREQKCPFRGADLAQGVCEELRQELKVDKEPLVRGSSADWSPGSNPELWLSGHRATTSSCV